MTDLESAAHVVKQLFISAPIIWKLTAFQVHHKVEVHHFLSLGGETDSFYQLYFKPRCEFGWSATLK